MDFNLELEQLRKQKKQVQEERSSLREQKEREIRETLEKISKKYAQMSRNNDQQLLESNKKIDTYCQMLEEYSTFNAKELGETITSLMRIFEGVNFVYQEAQINHTTEVQRLVFDSIEVDVEKHPRIIVLEEERKNSYSDRHNSLKSLVKQGKAIILVDDANPSDKYLSFYRADTMNHNIKQCINVGRFTYVKEFIDYLISYKIENQSHELSSDEIEKLKVEFISARTKQIEENYQKLYERQEEEMKQRLAQEKDHRELVLKRIMDKKHN